MGNVCCFKKKYRRKIVLLLIGLDNAGKTVAVKGLAGESLDTVLPTVGFYTVNLSYKGIIVKVYDLGGGPNIRGIWYKYFVDAHGIIFVIDASDITRIDEAKQVLQDVLTHEKISGKPVLFLANKQDRETALDEIDLLEKIDLEAIVNENQCPTLVECCSATNITNKKQIDPGIRKGYDWLVNYIDRNYIDLNLRVKRDVLEQDILEKQIREKTIERMKNMSNILEENNHDVIELYSEYARNLNENNGNLKSQETDITDKSDTSTSDSFPTVYHHHTNVLNGASKNVKSVSDIVKDQLNLCQKKPVKAKSNQTLPVHIIKSKLPQSAKMTRKNFSIKKRNLKSAGDVKLYPTDIILDTVLPNMIPGPSGDDIKNTSIQFNQAKSPQTNGLIMQSKRVNSNVLEIHKFAKENEVI